MIAFYKKVSSIWSRERPTILAAALAYYGIFSFAPLVFVSYTIAGFFIDTATLAQLSTERLEELFGTEIMNGILQVSQSTSPEIPINISSSWVISIASFLIVLWAASGLFYQMQYSLNTVWKVPVPIDKYPRMILRHRLLAFLMAVLVGLFLLLVATFNLFLRWMSTFFPMLNNFSWLSNLVFLIAFTGSLLLIYRFIPMAPVRWREVWPGAVTAGVMQTILMLGIGLFIQLGFMKSSLATAGVIGVLLMGFYYTAQIFLFGAVICRVYAEMLREKQASLPN